MHVNAYLNFGGNCADAFRYYEKHLGAKLLFSMTFAEAPPGNAPPGEFDPNSVMYSRISLGDTHIMGNDIPPSRYQPMRSAYVALSADSIEEAERIYKALADGGEIFMPIAETFFAFRFGMLRDKFGINWMVLHPRPMQS
ncbi:VOC family protein [Silvibacterium dinghuense]|uniref:VOC family protein n=2 Tax=Silvibacterium dinghuense TaxID=1560006 RepID=A0A4Q1SKW6_9BACT|nr:VOC family protein [Silvibacterium dinghuense]